MINTVTGDKVWNEPQGNCIFYISRSPGQDYVPA